MSSSRVPKAQLLVILENQEFRISIEGATTSIGSDPDCKLSLTSDGVEARHCIVQRGEDGFEVFDLFSDSGTLVNGKKVEAHPLKTGDQITIGSVRIVYIETDVAPAPQADVKPEVAAIPLEADPWESWKDDPFFRSESQRETGGDSPQAILPTTTDEAPPAAPPGMPPAGPGLGDRLRSWFERRAGQRVLREEERARQRSEPEETDRRQEAAAAAAFAVPAFDQRTMEEIAEEATRFHPATFNDVLVEQLRATPYFALSAMIHICLAIILNFLTTPVQEPRETPPFEAGFENRDVQTPDEVEADRPTEPDPEVEEETDPVDVTEPQEVILPNDPLDMDLPDTSSGSLEGPPLDTFSSGLAGGGLGNGLSGVGGINGGGKSFRRYVRSLRTSGLDIVVVIDSTGSMENVIQQARTQISRMITTVGGLVPNFRLGVVTYRDRGDEYLTRQLPLTPNYYEAVDFLDGLQADGGGDIPEAVLDGMKKAVRDMSWAGKAKRIVVLVGDAQPHARDMDSLRGLAADFTRKNGTVHTLATVADSFGNRRADPAAIRTFRAISKAGRGVSATLEDSGAVVRQIIEIAFGAEHKADIGEAISRAETGWRSRRYKRMVEAKDLKGLLAAMLRKPAPQALFRECLLANEAALLPVYLEALGHAHATLQTRWAATVLVKRLVRRNRDRRVRETARSLNPEGPLSRVKRRVTEFRRAARAAGLPTVMPND